MLNVLEKWEEKNTSTINALNKKWFLKLLGARFELKSLLGNQLCFFKNIKTNCTYLQCEIARKMTRISLSTRHVIHWANQTSIIYNSRTTNILFWYLYQRLCPQNKLCFFLFTCIKNLLFCINFENSLKSIHQLTNNEILLRQFEKILYFVKPF